MRVRPLGISGYVVLGGEAGGEAEGAAGAEAGGEEPHGVPVACKEHREASHVSATRRQCTAPGCTHVAAYGRRRERPGDSKDGGVLDWRERRGFGTVHCGKHREEAEDDLKHGTCSTDGLGFAPSACGAHRAPLHVAPRHRAAVLARWLQALPADMRC
ncbi:hypothetical protein T484DRAFT_1768622 [Baffinella frigidus]|nr:hypothetical protein T484DRAFT_1768622 [Cryptophyta sp. CCMP2293]